MISNATDETIEFQPMDVIATIHDFDHDQAMKLYGCAVSTEQLPEYEHENLPACTMTLEDFGLTEVAVNAITQRDPTIPQLTGKVWQHPQNFFPKAGYLHKTIPDLSAMPDECFPPEHVAVCRETSRCENVNKIC